MKPTLSSLHGLVGAADPPKGSGDASDGKDGGPTRAMSVKEFFEAGKAGDWSGADAALHSYVTQCEAEEPDTGGADDEEEEPEADDEE